MAVVVKQGDLLSSQAQTLVNTVNCVGIMGKGIALAFKQRFPDMFIDYTARCARHEVALRRPYLWRPASPPWVLNFPTKDHWRGVSKLSDIEAGLEYLQKNCKAWGVTSLAVPPLGCGQGGLEWRVVGRTLYRHLRKLDIPVELFAPATAPAVELETRFLEEGSGEHLAASKSTKISPTWVALAAIVQAITKERHHWPLGRIAFQKLAYFATAAGIPTGLIFIRGSYGPFAADAKPIVTKLVNNGVLVEKRLGKMFSVEPGPTLQDALKVHTESIARWGPQIAKVADLFLRMRTHDAEVAATVLFIANELKSRSDDVDEADVLRDVLLWKGDRLNFGVRETAAAVRHLNMLSWLRVRPTADLPIPEPTCEEAV